MLRRLRYATCRAAAFGALALLGARTARAQRIAEIQIAPPYLRMVPDAQTQVSATAYDTAGMPVQVRFRWSSSNINVAVVGENGMVRAIAPGATLITASAETERGRRRAGQITVRVVSPGPAPMVGPPPGAPGALIVPRGPTMVFSPHLLDSTMKASINCADPMMNAANPLNACYDQRPTPRGRPPEPAVTCTDGTNGIMVMMRVAENGEVGEVMPFARGSCPGLIEASVTAARGMTFNPALRAGRPVAAWVRYIIRTATPLKQ